MSRANSASSARRILLALLLIAAAAALHLAACEWQQFEMYDTSWIVGDGKSVVMRGSTGEAAARNSLEGMELFSELVAERAKRQQGTIFLVEDEFGKGFGLRVRQGLDVETGRWLGIILPVILLITIPFIALRPWG